jgi:hypothetical protein
MGPANLPHDPTYEFPTLLEVMRVRVGAEHARPPIMLRAPATMRSVTR